MKWKIEKSESGLSFYLLVGTPGIPGSCVVRDLTREQGEELGAALVLIENSARYDALEKVRDAIGIR